MLTRKPVTINPLATEMEPDDDQQGFAVMGKPEFSAYDDIIDRAPMDGIALVPPHADSVLEFALQRYLAIHQVTKGIVPLKQVLKDRSNYIDFYEPNSLGCINPEKQVAFMQSVSGYPADWCASYVYMDWLSRLAEGELEGDVEALIMEGYDHAFRISNPEDGLDA